MLAVSRLCLSAVSWSVRSSLAACGTSIPRACFCSSNAQPPFNTPPNPPDISRRPDDKVDVFQGDIPKEKLSISFSRSSGPGGQNVNKLNTKAEIRFHVPSAKWIPERVKSRLVSLNKNRMTKFREMIVVSQKYRTQNKNVEDALQKLKQLLVEASEVPKGPSDLTIARIHALKRKSERKRRVDKKYHSQKKLFRKTDFD